MVTRTEIRFSLFATMSVFSLTFKILNIMAICSNSGKVTYFLKLYDEFWVIIELFVCLAAKLKSDFWKKSEGNS